jgi:hypothetical protein
MRILPLTDQIKAVERELALRRNVYARRVLTGKMKQGQADREIALMTAVHETLVGLLASAPPGRVCDIVEDQACSLAGEADKVEYMSQLLGGLSGIAAAALGVEVTHALLDQCKQAATEVLADFKRKAN